VSKIREFFKNEQSFFQLKDSNIGVTIKKLPSIKKKDSFALEKNMFLTT